MGLFFSNLHILKPGNFSPKMLRSLLTECMTNQGFRAVPSVEDADFSLFLFDDGGKWISVCSDGLDFYEDKIVRDLCVPLSQQLSTDLVTISCFDSDCLLLNRINDKRRINAWAMTGRYPGIWHLPTPGKWKGLVNDIPKWKSALRKKHTFSEEALKDLEPMLGLSPGCGSFSDALFSESDYTETLWFTLPETMPKSEPPRLTIPSYSLTPCQMGQFSFIRALNAGGKSTGLGIAFSGDYVENEEIWFKDVQFEYGFDRHPRPTIPLQLEKRHLSNGQWIYYAEIPQFQLPPKVKEGLPWRKAIEVEGKRSFGVRFTPEGNGNKRLDITVHFIPLKNPEGQCAWCVWAHSSSKEAFIEEHNKLWQSVLGTTAPGLIEDEPPSEN